MVFISRIMLRMQQVLQQRPAEWLDFQNFVYDTGIVSVYPVYMLRAPMPAYEIPAVTGYICVLSLLCHNNARIRELLQRLDIIETLDHCLQYSNFVDAGRQNRAALLAALQAPVLPAAAVGALV
jgi:hypothetical protein